MPTGYPGKVLTLAEIRRRYREKHREAVKHRQKEWREQHGAEWREANRERLREYHRHYRAIHGRSRSDAERNYDRLRYVRNREKELARRKAYGLKNRARYTAIQRARYAQRRNAMPSWADRDR